MTDTEGIRLERAGHFATITLDRPRYRNAVSLPMLAALERTIDALRAAPPRAVILRASAPGFCSGIDLKESLGATPEFALFRVTMMHRMLGKLRSLPVPVVAAIDGVCTGLGCELAISADIRLATATSRFCYTEPRVAVPSPAHHLIRLIGLARAQEMLLTARWVEAEEAAQTGLVTRVVGDAEGAAREAAAQVAELAPLAVAWTKENIALSIREGAEAASQHHSTKIAVAAGTADRREALAAFGEKRQPQFKGE
jgi:enoyl-CoA hydratase/carnithine racemase